MSTLIVALLLLPIAVALLAGLVALLARPLVAPAIAALEAGALEGGERRQRQRPGEEYDEPGHEHQRDGQEHQRHEPRRHAGSGPTVWQRPWLDKSAHTKTR